ncbi:hypothetical protein PG997_005955 [Apiospora hydei]|uniref:Uncharacterized protein n=1 Tax=Apiospora hydei TaxID=1337664 RepID=A0ABR1WMB6_9PEZI
MVELKEELCLLGLPPQILDRSCWMLRESSEEIVVLEPAAYLDVVTGRPWETRDGDQLSRLGSSASIGFKSLMTFSPTAAQRNARRVRRHGTLMHKPYEIWATAWAGCLPSIAEPE